MYNPVQIPSILDKIFIKKVHYKEYICPSLEQYIMCIWSMKSYQELQQPVTNVILPDGCIDLIVDFSNQEIYFSGTSKATLNFPLLGKIDFMGIRIKPGVFYNIFNVSCTKVMDTLIPYNQIEREYELEKILELDDYQQRIDFLVNYFSSKVSATKFDILTEKLLALSQKTETKSVTEVAQYFGYSTRQLNRIFKDRCGVSAKVFLNIIRLHTSLNLLIHNQRPKLTELAQESGFYDEAHFIKEIKKYCGISPTDVIKRYNMS